MLPEKLRQDPAFWAEWDYDQSEKADESLQLCLGYYALHYQSMQLSQVCLSLLMEQKRAGCVCIKSQAVKNGLRHEPLTKEVTAADLLNSLCQRHHYGPQHWAFGDIPAQDGLLLAIT